MRILLIAENNAASRDLASLTQETLASAGQVHDLDEVLDIHALFQDSHSPELEDVLTTQDLHSSVLGGRSSVNGATPVRDKHRSASGTTPVPDSQQSQIPALHELRCCYGDLQGLAAMDVNSFDLLIWGGFTDASTSRMVLAELHRQQSSAPVLMVVDEAPAEADSQAMEQGFSDILLRSQLTSQVLSNALIHVSARRQSWRVALEGASDPLTGLINRQEFRDQLEGMLKGMAAANSVALLLIDIDRFKKVNAAYGQGVGDALIQQIVERLKSCLSSHQRLARLGGNEFAVVFQNSITSVENACRIRVEKIVQAMSRPFSLGQHVIKINVSMGIAVNKDVSISVDALLANADIAMRVAKQDKGTCYQLYTSAMTDASQQVLKLEAGIRRAIRREEFELYYQPRIDIKSNTIVGVEALIRWRHPVRGLLPPGEFIGVAEESGLIVPLGYWIIHKACMQLAQLTREGYTELTVAVNVSFKQFQDKNFVNTVADIVRHHDVDARRLEFELTETTMMIEGEAVNESLRALNDLGIYISLDDFGTGYSSFAHIQRLPISILKIDRSFVSNVTVNEDDATIVKAIINLAHSLNMQIVAEGAETVEQVDFLLKHKCDQVQGYYFSRPVPYHELEQLLEKKHFAEFF